MRYCLLIPLLFIGCGNGAVDTKSIQVITWASAEEGGVNLYRVTQVQSMYGDWHFRSTNAYKIGDIVKLTTPVID